MAATTPPPPPPPPSKERPPVVPPGSDTSDTRDTRARAKGSAPKATPARKPPLQRRLEEFFAAPAAVYAAVGHQYPAQIIAVRSPALAEDLYKLSQENPAVKRLLERLMEGGAWGGVVVSVASILLPILSYHGVDPLGDPFQGFMEGPSLPTRGPIVPPPPAPAPSASPGSNGGGRDDTGFTPGVGSGPPGTVTVAGSNAAHVG